MIGSDLVDSALRSSSRPSHVIRPARIERGLAAIFVAAAVMAFASNLAAKKKPPVEKSVSGQVLDSSDRGVPNAAVELTDLEQNKTVALYTDATGHYTFSPLDRHHDYQIVAKTAGLSSDIRRISSLDERDRIVVNLTLKPPKP